MHSPEEGQALLVSLDSRALHDLEPEALAWACIGPVITRVRGASPSSKRALYSTLTPGQQSLFIFWALHGHSESAASFQITLAYLVRDLGASSELEAAAQRLGSHDLVRLYRACSSLFSGSGRRDGAGAVSLDQDVQPLYERYLALAPEVIRGIADYIRRSPQEFIRAAGA